MLTDTKSATKFIAQLMSTCKREGGTFQILDHASGKGTGRTFPTQPRIPNIPRIPAIS